MGKPVLRWPPGFVIRNQQVVCSIPTAGSTVNPITARDTGRILLRRCGCISQKSQIPTTLPATVNRSYNAAVNYLSLCPGDTVDQQILPWGRPTE